MFAALTGQQATWPGGDREDQFPGGTWTRCPGQSLPILRRQFYPLQGPLNLSPEEEV